MISATLGLSRPQLTHLGNRDYGISYTYLRGIKKNQEARNFGMASQQKAWGMQRKGSEGWGRCDVLQPYPEKGIAFASSSWEVTTKPLECSA